MNKKITYLALAGSVILMSSCSKKLNQFQSEYFNTNPTPLEVVGQNVPGTIVGNIPAKFFLKNAKVEVTPVLQWELGFENGTPVYGESKGAPYLVQGEEVRANGQVINYETGGTIGIPFMVEYQPEMAQSNLYLDFQVDQNGKVYALPRVKVGEGVITTATLASATTVTPAVAKDKFQKIINETYSADIHFLINQANVRKSETESDEYIDLNRRLIEASEAPNMEIAGVEINSYASPEGSMEVNTRLAEKREQNTTAFIEEQLKKDKITEFGELTSNFTPEDWEGFKELVEESNIQDKELILSVLSMYNDPEQREQEIRNLSVVFDQLADQILPQLRYSRIQASINVIGKSDKELINLFDNNPSGLSVDEILYLATLTDDNSKKMEIYGKATELYPNDYRTHNNLGLTQFVAGNYEAAKSSFDNAARLNSNSQEVEMNQGLISMLNKDYRKANEQFGAAAGVPEVSDALGVYYLSQGDVNAAIRAFGDTKSNNAALAQILAKDYSAARRTLSSIATPDATTYYLTAILGARTNNENMVMSNLRQAIRMDESLAQRAKTDLEFKNFNLSHI